METNNLANSSTKNKKLPKRSNVPEALVYEMMDGNPIYYAGYKSVLNNKRKIEDIIGNSSLQAIIVTYTLRCLHKTLSGDNYWILAGEPGIQLDSRNEFVGAILILKKAG